MTEPAIEIDDLTFAYADGTTVFDHLTLAPLHRLCERWMTEDRDQIRKARAR